MQVTLQLAAFRKHGRFAAESQVMEAIHETGARDEKAIVCSYCLQPMRTLVGGANLGASSSA